MNRAVRNHKIFRAKSLCSHSPATMITRRRGRTISHTKPPSVEVEVVDVVENDEDFQNPSEGFHATNAYTSGLDFKDLFGMEELDWTLDNAATSPLFDMEFADLGVHGAKDQGSGTEASTSSSPERVSQVNVKTRQNQSRNVINKNAIAARLNRLKKKEYVNSLEKKVGSLSTENGALKQENCQLTKRVEELEDETRASTQMTTTMPYRGNA